MKFLSALLGDTATAAMQIVSLLLVLFNLRTNSLRPRFEARPGLVHTLM